MGWRRKKRGIKLSCGWTRLPAMGIDPLTQLCLCFSFISVNDVKRWGRSPPSPKEGPLTAPGCSVRDTSASSASRPRLDEDYELKKEWRRTIYLNLWCNKPLGRWAYSIFLDVYTHTYTHTQQMNTIWIDLMSQDSVHIQINKNEELMWHKCKRKWPKVISILKES